MVDLPIRIQEKRRENGYNKSKLGSLLGITGTAIKQYEDGKNYPKTEVLLAMSKILKWDFINDKPLESEIFEDCNKNVTNELLGNNSVENKTDYTLSDPENVNQNAIFKFGSGENIKKEASKLLQLIDNQQQQIRLLHQQVELLSGILLN